MMEKLLKSLFPAVLTSKGSKIIITTQEFMYSHIFHILSGLQYIIKYNMQI